MTQLRNKSTYDVLFRPAMKAKPLEQEATAGLRLRKDEADVVAELSEVRFGVNKCHNGTRSEVRLGEKRMGRTARSSQLGMSQGCPQISLRQVNSELFLQYPPILRFVLERMPFDLT